MEDPSEHSEETRHPDSGALREHHYYQVLQDYYQTLQDYHAIL